MSPHTSLTLPLLAGVLLACLPSVAHASITMTDSGQRFRSKVDPHLGKPLWTGYDYYARLQTLPAHNSSSVAPADNISDLCQPPPTNNLTVPSDGLPVALLVQGGGCSAQQKVQVALQYLQPAPLLRFLIINDVDHHQKGRRRQRTSVLEDTPEHVRDAPDRTIPIHILHITNPVYEQLLDNYILPDAAAPTRAAGGPRVTIDSSNSAGYFGLLDGMTALWVSIFAICSACACTIVILVGNSMNQHNHDWEEWNRQQQLQQQQQQRRQRRRLTREQIRALLPQYRYDGQELHWVKAGSQVREELGEDTGAEDVWGNRGGPTAEDAAGWEDALQPPQSDRPLPPRTLCMPLDMDCCSVCLDDYEVGDKIRVLPCNHCFHSRCVGRWLAERSATCPLCKTELWPEEEEGEEERGEPTEGRREGIDTRAAVEEDSFWNRFFFGSNPDMAATEGVAHAAGTEQEMTTLPSRPESMGAVARAVRRSWLQRIFPSSVTTPLDDQETTNMLTEPLLADEETGQGGMEIIDTDGRVEDAAATVPTTRESNDQPQEPHENGPEDADGDASQRNLEELTAESMTEPLEPSRQASI